MHRPKITVALTGSRTWQNIALVRDSLLRMLDTMDLTIRVGFHPEKQTPKGLDHIAYHLLQELSIPHICYPADWDKYGKGAGMLRNKDMVRESDYVVGFWDGVSVGTANALYHAWHSNKIARVYLSDGRRLESDTDYLYPHPKKAVVMLPPLDPLIIGEERVHQYLASHRIEEVESGRWKHPDIGRFSVATNVAYLWHIRDEPPIQEILSEFA